MNEREKTERLRAVLLMVLDAVDYTAGACRPNEMVGACLDKKLIEIAKTALDETKPSS